MEFQIPVRSLVEFMLRYGDIDNRKGKGAEDAMLEGARLHRAIQKSQGIWYSAEVPLAFCVPMEGYTLKIDGRADGVIRKDDEVTVDEIKCTYADIQRFEEPELLHLAQAKCYAAIIVSQEELESIGVRITYCNIRTEEKRYFDTTFSADELKSWFDGLVTAYAKWTDLEYHWKQKRNESMNALEFPYAFRDGQKELAGHVYQTICHGKKLFVQAPTGVGKTLSCVFPAVKAVGLGKADRIFYLTAKTVTATAARQAFDILTDKGLFAKILVLTAKEKICPLDETECNPDACPYAKGHYDRINDAVYELLQTEDMFDRDRILEAAKERCVCPFELSLDMSLFSDVIICDYNYLFDPYVYLKRFFSESVKGPYLFLIDEAHNLLERGRSMYSAQLIKEDVLTLKRSVKGKGTGLEKYIDGLNRAFLGLKKQDTGLKDEAERMALDQSALRLYGAISTFLEEHENSPLRDEVLEYYFELGRYLDTTERFDEGFLAYTFMFGDDCFGIKLLCVDPSRLLDKKMHQGVSSVLFSATLLPIRYYKSLLGGSGEDFEVYARTSFSRDQFCLMIGKDVTTRYTERGRRQYEMIAEYIHSIVSAKTGNYMIFCPSYMLLEEVSSAFERLYYDEKSQKMLLQESYMDEEQREQFLSAFGESGNVSLLGFCVMGGIFSEGIDLKGEKLIGSIIVGTGLPQISEEGEYLKQYFDERSGDGFDYAYRYPGMNKVLQAAGRVIRSSQDRGIIALLDERFTQSSYRKLFPREWSGGECFFASAAECGKIAADFWENKG